MAKKIQGNAPLPVVGEEVGLELMGFELVINRDRPVMFAILFACQNV